MSNGKPIIAMTGAEKELSREVINLIMQQAQEHGLCLTSVLGLLQLVERTVQDQILNAMAQEFARRAATGIRIARPGELPEARK